MYVHEHMRKMCEKCATSYLFNQGVFITDEGELRVAAHIILPPYYNMIHYDGSANMPQLQAVNYFEVWNTSKIPRWFHIKVRHGTFVSDSVFLFYFILFLQ